MKQLKTVTNKTKFVLFFDITHLYLKKEILILC